MIECSSDVTGCLQLARGGSARANHADPVFDWVKPARTKQHRWSLVHTVQVVGIGGIQDAGDLIAVFSPGLQIVSRLDQCCILLRVDEGVAEDLLQQCFHPLGEQEVHPGRLGQRGRGPDSGDNARQGGIVFPRNGGEVRGVHTPLVVTRPTLPQEGAPIGCVPFSVRGAEVTSGSVELVESGPVARRIPAHSEAPSSRLPLSKRCRS